MDRRTIAVIGSVAVVFHVLGGMVNVWHWYNVGWDATSYHVFVPYFGVGGWLLLVAVYWYNDVRSLAAWAIAVWWLVYNIILFCMVHGVISL